MTSRSAASIAQPSWGSAARPLRGASVRPVPAFSGPVVRWGIRGRGGSDVAAGVALLAATAGLWAAFLLCVG
jgi:hypothetical protein